MPALEDYTDKETGLLHCGNCHTLKECRVTLFDKEKLMPCTCHCRQEQIAVEEQARKEQQRLDRIRRLKANGLQDRALFAYTFDNAVAEATFKIIKTEFIYGTKFDTLEQLQIGFMDYVNWFNNIRIHGSLGYLTPAEFKNITL